MIAPPEVGDYMRRHTGLTALQKIDAEAERMESLIKAMRQLLGVELRGEIERVDLKAVAEGAFNTVSLKLGFRDWFVECTELPAAAGRRALLHQLFLHLIENAVKFRAAGRRLRVSVRGREVQANRFEATRDRYDYITFAQIEISDNGRGFDPKYREYVFQLLQKVDLDSPGLGVGLAIARKIAALHYGTLKVDSTPGLGTTFTLMLPLEA